MIPGVKTRHLKFINYYCYLQSLCPECADIQTEMWAMKGTSSLVLGDKTLCGAGMGDDFLPPSSSLIWWQDGCVEWGIAEDLVQPSGYSECGWCSEAWQNEMVWASGVCEEVVRLGECVWWHGIAWVCSLNAYWHVFRDVCRDLYGANV